MKVLLLGEASFRYSLALVRSRRLPPGSAVTASCFGRLPASDLEANVAELQREARVLFDVGAKLRWFCVFLAFFAPLTNAPDATDLSRFDEVFDRVFFLFPIADKKGRVDLTRELLRDTFCSVRRILAPKGVMYVALAKGQGGTEFEEEDVRHRTNSFEIAKCASYGQLYLSRVSPFDDHEFGYNALAPHGYRQTGRRGNDSSFHVSGALMHELVHRDSGLATVQLTYEPRDVSFWHPADLDLDQVSKFLMEQEDVVKCNLHDSFKHPDSGKQSVTLRLSFRGFLSPLDANNLQQLLGERIAETFPGTEIR